MESPHEDPTTPVVAPATACACPTDWADEVHRAGQICRKTGRQGDREDSPTHRAEQVARGHLLTLPALPYPAHQPRHPSYPAPFLTMPTYPACRPFPPADPARLPTLPHFLPCPHVSYCQQERHTRTPQNGLLSSPFTIFRFIKTLHTDTQQLTCILNIISIILGRFTAPKR